jgi:hypothetical protein
LVTSGTQAVKEVTPTAGKTLYIESFEGNDSTSALAACLLVWDNGGPSEEILWAINQGKGLPQDIRRPADGIKKLAIILDNACTNDYYMSAHCEYDEED